MRSSLVVFVGVLLAAPSAFAGDAASAEALFVQGRAAADRGDHATACAKFAESNRLDPAPGTVFNLGDCSEQLGKLATAWQYFREVVQRLPPNDERVAIAKGRANKLEKRVPKLTIKLAADAPAGAIVSRDGNDLGAASLGVPLPIDPGEHKVEVKAEGRQTSLVTITIVEASEKTLDVNVGAATTAVTGPGLADSPPSSDGKRTAGWVAVGVGGAAFAVGAVTGLMALGKKSTVDANCDADKRCSQTGLDAADSGRTLGKVSSVGFVLGVAGLGVGGYLLATNPKRESAFVPWVDTKGGGGFSLARRF